MTNNQFFEETIYITPSQLSSDVQRHIADCTRQAAGALGLSEGPIHAELRLGRDGLSVTLLGSTHQVWHLFLSLGSRSSDGCWPGMRRRIRGVWRGSGARESARRTPPR